jgi:hypothetical protein
MRLAAMQPYFFPYLGYFQLIAAADQFLLYDNLNYMRQGWVHRNRIRLKGRGEFYCVVPLLGASSNARIHEVRVDPAQRWPGRFLDLIEHNYKKAPFFGDVFPVIEQAVRHPATHLTDVNRHGIRAVAEFLGIATPISHDTAPFQPFEEAVRAEHSPWLAALARDMGTAEIKTLRVLYLCRQVHADTYLNPPGGRDLYSPEMFAQNGVTLQFLLPTLAPYPQQGDGFLPGLSILDVLMNCGREGTRRQLPNFAVG